jgi:polynucleotide 5'-kinase involved in rRNA processing
MAERKKWRREERKKERQRKIQERKGERQTKTIHHTDNLCLEGSCKGAKTWDQHIEQSYL